MGMPERMRIVFSYVKTSLIVLLITASMLAALEMLLSVHAINKTFSPDERLNKHANADCYTDKAAAKAYYREFDRSNQMRWEAYTYWRRKAFKGSFINVDERGIRSTYNAAHGQRREAKVFVFGGSTAWGTGARDEYTIPSFVSKLLDRDGYAVSVTNFGESGYVSSQEMIALLKELQGGNVPDVAIFYDGVNDSFSSYQNKRAGIPQNEEKRRRYFTLERDLEGSGKGFLLRALIENSKIMQLARYIGGRRHKAKNPYMDDDAMSRLSAGVADVYRQNMRMVSALGDAYGFKALFYWQPVIFTKRDLSPYEKTQATQSDDEGAQRRYFNDYRQLYAMTSQGLRDRAASGSASFHDISDILDDRKGPLYLDFCHTCEAANEIIAARITSDVEGILKSRKPD